MSSQPSGRSRHASVRTWEVAILTLVLGACASKGTVVLLPESDGRDTAVVVKQGDKQVVLDKPYAAAQQTTFGPRAYQSSAQEVAAAFGPALAAQPPRPKSFTLYFVEGSKDELTEDSKQVVESVFAEIARHPVPDIVVVGHTDRVGSDPFNDNLARQRAETVRDELIRRGIAPENVVASGRGSREPLVATATGVAEPRNRRVEIIVR